MPTNFNRGFSVIGSEFMNTIVTQYDHARKWLETRMKARPDAGNVGHSPQIVVDVNFDSLTRGRFVEIKVVRVDEVIYHLAEVGDWPNIT